MTIPQNRCSLFALAVFALLSLATIRPSAAQSGRDGLPDRRYFSAVESIYSGKIRDAQRVFLRETKRGVRVGSFRWIDSICYHAMLGETYFQMGNLAGALAEFDQACQLYMQYPDWLTRAKFSMPPRVDTNRARLQGPAWGRSQRNLTPGHLPGTMMVLHGRQQSLEEIKQRQVTVVETPQYFQVNVPEIVRCTALAIRRRNEILGPLGKHDSISKELVSVLSRGGLSPPNHWSRGWIELQLGLAQIGVGSTAEAQPHLSRALLIDGRFEHPLTCVVMLEQGRMALEAGSNQLAMQLFAEASYSAYWYENYNVIDEALRLGALNHIISAAPTVYPPLDMAASWSSKERLRLLTTNLRIAQAEGLATLGQTDSAGEALVEATRWLGEMGAGPAGTQHLYVQALVQYQRGRTEDGDDLLAKALARKRVTSVRTFQLQLTNRLFDGDARGRITSRVASLLYQRMLSDPLDRDWLQSPLDTLAQLTSPYEDAMDRWFVAMLQRKDVLAAIEVADQAKRRRFLTALPWGGRLLALRRLLGLPTDQQENVDSLQRQQILTDFPALAKLTSESIELERILSAGPILADAQPEASKLKDLYSKWGKSNRSIETILREIATRRIPSRISFPPVADMAQIQGNIPEGQVVVVFHTAGGTLHGFLLTGTDYTHWQLGREADARASIGDLLRQLGNYGPGRNLTSEDIDNNDWRQDAQRIYQQIFGNSRLSLGETNQLAIVPDGLLWHLPFELLIPNEGDETPVLVDQALVRYAPLASLIYDNGREFARTRHTGIVAPDVPRETAEAYVDEAMDELSTTVSEPVVLAAPLPYSAQLLNPLLDQLVSFEELQWKASEPFDWLLLPKERGRNNRSALNTLGMPYGGPERVVLAGLGTAAENGLKKSGRRGDRVVQRPGNEMFLSTCMLMANGARTALLSRWRTSGKTNMALVKEFAQELPFVSASAAWQRSILLAREAPLIPTHEPRLKSTERDADSLGVGQTAEHPFFWAGYLLIDSGYDPVAIAAAAEAAAETDAPAVNFEKPTLELETKEE